MTDRTKESMMKHTLINPPAAWLDVLAERQRQVRGEGWTPDLDDAYKDGEMAQAAACYALNAAAWFKPTDRRRDLIKATALLLAEVERLDRAASAREGRVDG